MSEENNFYTTSTGKVIEYSNTPKAISMRKSRSKPGKTKPKNVSKDYTDLVKTIIYPVDSRGRKIRNSKPIKIIKNYKGVEDLIEKLEYQSKIKDTTFKFFDTKGKFYVTKNIKEIAKMLRKFKLDLSRGIYVYQIYHCDLSRLNSDNAGKTDDGCYDNAINKMNQRKCSVTFFRKGSNEKKTVFSAFELSLYKNDIDWNRLVFLIDTKPEKYDSDRWNDEIQGYWLILSKLTTKEQAEKYEYNKHVLKPLHTFMKYKIMVDRCIINGGIHSSFSKKKDITLESMLKDYGTFSYHYINKIFNDGSLLKRILKYWKKFFNLDSWVTFRNDLKKAFSGTLLICGECEDFFDGLVLKFAKMLDIDCTSYIEKLRNKKKTNQTYYNIQCPDFFYDYEVLQRLYRDERYKKSDYVNYIEEISVLDRRDSISNNFNKFYEKPSYAYNIKYNYDDGENTFSDFASFSLNAY